MKEELNGGPSMQKQQKRIKRALTFVRSATADSTQLHFQEKFLREFAADNSIDIVGGVVIEGGAPFTARAIDSVLARKSELNDFDTLLVTDLTRLLRSGVYQGLWLLLRLKAAGIKILTVSEGLVLPLTRSKILFQRWKKKGLVSRGAKEKTTDYSSHKAAHVFRRAEAVCGGDGNAAKRPDRTGNQHKKGEQ